MVLEMLLLWKITSQFEPKTSSFALKQFKITKIA